LLREDEEFRLAVMGLIGYADLKSSVDRLVEAVNELTKLAKAHEERLVKVEDRLSRIETTIEELTRAVKAHDERLARLESAVEELTKAVKAHEERLARLESAVQELTKIVKAHEERLAKLEERVAGVEDRLTRLEAVVEELAKATRENTKAIEELTKIVKEHGERLGRIERRLTGIENMLNNLTIGLEYEANHVVQHLLKQRGIEIRTRPTFFDRRYEFDIYGTSEQLTIIGDAKVKVGPKAVRRLVGRVDRVMKRWPDRFKGRVVVVLYCLRALEKAVDIASKYGVWLIEDMEERTKPI
jgi:uncharacterized coiled-coil protein SlyX